MLPQQFSVISVYLSDSSGSGFRVGTRRGQKQAEFFYIIWLPQCLSTFQEGGAMQQVVSFHYFSLSLLMLDKDIDRGHPNCVLSDDLTGYGTLNPSLRCGLNWRGSVGVETGWWGGGEEQCVTNQRAV